MPLVSKYKKALPVLCCMDTPQTVMNDVPTFIDQFYIPVYVVYVLPSTGKILSALIIHTLSPLQYLSVKQNLKYFIKVKIWKQI